MKMPKYSHLLSPLKIGDTVIKNRMMSPYCLPKYIQGPETYPSENYTAFFANFARNGAGIVVVSEWDRYPDQRKGPITSPHTHMPAFDVTDPATLNYISELTEEVHLFGSKILIECWPCRALALPDLGDPQAAMARGSWPAPDTPEAELEAAVARYLETVQKYVDCGFDGVTARIDPLLVPWESDGSAEKGLSVEYRTGFTLRCFRKLKERYGSGFIIEGVLGGEQPYGYVGKSNTGYTVEEFVEFGKLAEGAIDIFQIRNNNIIDVHPTGFNFQKGQHPNLAYCKALKDAGVNILAMPIGGFQDPEEMDRLIAEGKCDMIGMARAFMADYDFLKKIEEGRGEDIRPCIWCNSCHGPTNDTGKHGPWVNRCTVNPELGFEAREHRLVKAPDRVKRVAIIGGGVAGMQAAITAAERGHQVTLFEATDYLGGQLYHTESFSFKWPLRDYKNWLVRRLGQLGVDIRLGTKATPQLITAGGFDAVIAATGARPVFPENIQGLRNADGSIKEGYRHVHQVFGRESELGKRVFIIGGSETGVETAMYLAENGHEVTILTRQEQIGYDCSKSHYITAAWMDPRRGDGRADQAPAWTKYEGFTSITGVTTTGLEGNTVYYTDASGKEYMISGDNILFNSGVKPLQDEALSFYGTAEKFSLIGDCNGVGNVQKCVREGWSRASSI
jgi:2,4-dienoyl-CoA reductase-like NADH-dependent reductase (Old Yellow Enzyme family)